jgi:hypothetical protein
LAFGRDLLCLVMGRSPFIAPRVRLGASLRRHPAWRPAFSSHLEELATDDAEQAHSDMMRPDKKFPFVRAIFTSLPEAQPVTIA